MRWPVENSTFAAKYSEAHVLCFPHFALAHRCVVHSQARSLSSLTDRAERLEKAA